MDESNKKTKAPRRLQKFKNEYKEKFPWITSSERGENFAFCKTCRCNMSIGHGGLNDLKAHAATEKHKKSQSEVQSTTRKITSYVKKDDFALSVVRAEVAFTDFLVENSIQIAVADHSGKLFRKMFPDSEIAKRYSCARTKTSHIVNYLSREDSHSLAERMKKQPFSLATDGSTDMDAVKLYPILIKTFDESTGQVVTELLSMKECADRSTSENIFKLLDNELTSLGIEWKNCLSFATDNASVMIGKHKGVATHIKKKHPNLYVMGCPCHLMHLAAKKGGNTLAYEVDELLVEIWYYIDKSSLRHQAIIKLQEEHGTEVRKVLKHVSTRWLSLGKAVTRLLDNWEALKDFFKSESESTSRKRKASSNIVTVVKKIKAVQHGTREPSTSASSSQTATSKTSDNNAWKKSSVDPQSTSFAQGNSDSINPKPVKQFDITGYLFSQKQLAQKQLKTKSKSNGESTSVKSSKSGAAKSSKSGAVNQASKNGTAKSSKNRTPSDSPVTKSARVYQQLNDPNCKLYALFLKTVLPFFDHPNEMLQRDEPQIHCIRDILLDQLASLLSRFVKPSAINEADDITKLNLDNENIHKSSDDIQIGYECKTYLKENRDKLNVRAFYKDVKKFYMESSRYMIAHYPYEDDLLIHAKVVDIKHSSKAVFFSGVLCRPVSSCSKTINGSVGIRV